MADRLKRDKETKLIIDEPQVDSPGQISLFQVPAGRPIVKSLDSEWLLVGALSKSTGRLGKPKPLKHKQVSARACNGTLKPQPKNPANYLICSKCGQLIGRSLVEAKGFLWK